MTARVKAYAAVWVVLVVGVVTLFALQHDLDVLILRQPGTLYATFDGHVVANFYNLQVINRTSRPHALQYRVASPAGASITALGPAGAASPHGLIETRLLVTVPAQNLAGTATPVRFEVRSDGRLVDVIDSSFLGPGR